jgi:hypothetical protein
MIEYNKNPKIYKKIYLKKQQPFSVKKNKHINIFLRLKNNIYFAVFFFFRFILIQ